MTPSKKIEDYINSSFVIAGVGNELKEFDKVGIEIARRGKKIYPERFIDCGAVPENYLDKIIRKKVGTLIIVDTVYFKGIDDVKVFLPEELTFQGISSHSLSLNFIAEYLKNWEIKTIIIGIKPTPRDNQIQEKVLSDLFKLISGEKFIRRKGE